ncbi:MAG: peptide deformylase [Nitratireductor sp.]
MSVREIIHLPDPLLREVSKPVEDINAALKKVLADMLETMYDAPGIGLAGIQIALPLRVVTVDCGDPELEAAEEAAQAEWEERALAAQEAGEEPPEPREKAERSKRPITLINPEVVKFSDAPSTYEEGCLSIPDYYADVERPAGCVVEYLDIHGKQQTLEAEGILSTCLQHEIDHLNGELFIDHISKLKKQMVMKKFTKIAKQSGKGPVSPLVI